MYILILDSVTSNNNLRNHMTKYFMITYFNNSSCFEIIQIINLD